MSLTPTVAVSTAPSIIFNPRNDQAPIENERPRPNPGLAQAKKMIEVHLAASGDDRTMNQLITDTFEKLNIADLKKFDEFKAVQQNRAAALRDLSELKNLIQTQLKDDEFNLEASFFVSENSPMWADGIHTATLRQTMHYYQTEYPDLGFPPPPDSLRQLGNYSEILSSTLTNVLSVASQQDLTDLQQQMQHMHAMRDLQSALLKSMGDVNAVSIRGI